MIDNVTIGYPYSSGNHTALVEEHTEAFEAANSFDSKPMRISGTYLDFGTDAYPDIYDSYSFADKYDDLTYGSGSEAVDLREYPIVAYYLSQRAALSAEATSGARTHALKELVKMAKTAYTATADPPVVVYSETPDMPDIGRPPFTAESLANDRLTQMCWLTIFPPALVDTYGRETLLSAPAWHVEELDDGAIMIVCHDDLSWQTSIYPVASHVGLPSYESHI